jgi:hypothetical protein
MTHVSSPIRLPSFDREVPTGVLPLQTTQGW